MQIENPIQMNDWGMKKFLHITLAIQLAMWGSVGLDSIGIQIPILRQLIAFIYLAFIPGIIILRILKLHKLGNIETLLYAVGLSIATLMFIGLFMNIVYPFFSISKPFSISPLIITVSAFALILCILCYIRDKDFSNPSFINIKDLLSPPTIFLCLIPFLSIFGTYLVNLYQNNIILIFMILLISVIVLFIGFDKFIPEKSYPLAVFVISLALLLHNSLISIYIWGWDIHFEYYLSNLVMANSVWDSTIPYSTNATLSIVMLVPIFSNILGMSLAWVFKIIYPLFFSLVPLGLYSVFQKQTNNKIAFLACFFFVSLFTFYNEMLSLARQQIAELFLVLLILLMIDKDLNRMNRSILLIIFGFSLAVSHYGLSYIYMAMISMVWLLISLSKNPAIKKLNTSLFSKFYRHKDEAFATNNVLLRIKDRSITSTFIKLFAVFTLTWYIYNSNSSSFIGIVKIGDQIVSNIYRDFLNPEAAQGLRMMMDEPKFGFLGQIHKVINYLNQIFILVGVCVLLLKYRHMKFQTEFTAFSLINLAVLLAGISVPILCKFD